MPTLVIPDALQITIGGFIDGQRWNNVLGVVNDSPFLMSQSVAEEIEQCVENMFIVLQPYLSGGWQYDEFIIRDIRLATNGSYEVNRAALVGTGGGQSMPPQCAIVASHSTGLRGRSYRGRTYLTGWNEDANSAVGQVTSTIATAIESAFSTFRTSLASVTGGPFEQAVLSRALLVATPVVDTTVDTEWDRQDRRKRSS